jgi:hypothetical protein
MTSDQATATAAQLMSAFARRTGLYPASQSQQRYLWTDAFAVCNFLELYNRTGEENYCRCATDLIDRVHQVLGRHRADDVRQGWLSGLDEQAGQHHPTKGGLRIGKPLKERQVGEPIDERLEWDRDGQYFHYLTKWMHALCRAGLVTGVSAYIEQARELAAVAFSGFAHKSGSGDVVGIYWKMSADLSRPLTYAMGLHDALDGYVTFRELQHASRKQPTFIAPDLTFAIQSLSTLCHTRDWTTTDPLGIGGLLFDACRLSQLIGSDTDQELLQQLIGASEKSLRAFLSSKSLRRSSMQRLAFRELGLAIGLMAAPTIFNRAHGPRNEYRSLADKLVSVWLPLAHSPDELWRAHQDINDVMLATALIPETFLSLDESIS